MMPLPRILLQSAVIAALGLLAGLAINHRLVLDAIAGRLAPPATAVRSAVDQLPQPALLTEVRELLAAGARPVDAREAAQFADGHLPGALSLPLGEFDVQLEDFRRQVAAGETLVLYCSGYGCPDSFDLGLLLMAAGYRDVRVFEGGLPEWRDAGLPVAREGGR
jgi:rhodanese-related sulfurtransferase